MGIIARNIDISDLPNFAQKQLMDYYLFLKQKYSLKRKATKKSDNKLPKSFYKPLLVNKYEKYDRTEIYNNG